MGLSGVPNDYKFGAGCDWGIEHHTNVAAQVALVIYLQLYDC